MNTILINISVKFSSEIDKHILKFIWDFKGCRIAETILQKKNKFVKLLPQFQTWYKKKNNFSISDDGTFEYPNVKEEEEEGSSRKKYKGPMDKAKGG